MKERERAMATGLTILLLILWLGFFLHQSPQFAGSFWGGMLALSGSVLMLVPLAYLIIKRIKRVKTWVTKSVSMRTLLAWHIYAGILGPILVLLHTGHKFESPLGITLTAITLLVVLSGFVGRYMMQQFSQEIREKNTMLAELNTAYEQTRRELAAHPKQVALIRPYAGFFTRLMASLFLREHIADSPTGDPSLSPRKIVQIAESIADLEYAIKTHEQFKHWFGKWLKFHIVISFILYGLLALHVYFAIYFGLRWFD